jgi:Cu/Ag efflux protein CusF
MSVPADLGKSAPAEQETIVARKQGVAVGRAPATNTLRGLVDSVDQSNDTIKIRLSPDTTEQFKVQDGLIFNAVRFGDAVEFSVQNISGTRTIVGLSKE